jgi:hypothetical protein
MSSILHIDGMDYHPATVAAKQLGYTKEYILMLAKQGKIDGQKISNKWYVQLSSVEAYFATARESQEERRRTVSEERKRELRERTSLRTHDAQREHRIGRRTRALAETMAVLVIGLVVGTTGHVSMEMRTQQASLASVSDIVDTLALSVYRAVVPEPDLPSMLTVQDAEVDAMAVHSSLWTGGLVHSPVQAVQDSFSDTVEVFFDPANPSVAVVTPYFKTGEGDAYRFLLTPVEVKSEHESIP